MEAAKKRHPSLPANYVTLNDLRERWLKKQEEQRKLEQCGGGEEVAEVKDDGERAEAGRDKGVVVDDHLEQNQPSVFRSTKPNPYAAPRKQRSYGRSRPADTRNYRWVKVCQPKSSLAPPQSQPKQAREVTTMQPKPEPVAREIGQKAVPVHLQSKPKPPPSEALKVESAVVPRGDDLKLDREMEEAKNRVGKKRERNRRKKNVAESKPQGKQEILEPGVAAAGGRKIVTEIENKLEDLSLNGGTGTSISRRSISVRNPRRGRKDGGGYGKFEDTIPMKKGGRAKQRGSVGIWVKKGEASVLGAASVENTSAVGINSCLGGSC